ncbi:MAG: DegV family EDD domain-containing protein [Clostridia bacterium]|nr:DegV family EDD domain-containing protein [Clostridia bacterium]
MNPTNPILLVAESGSDITPEIAKQYGVTIVPMHVAYGGQTRDDGSFPVTEMFEHYAKTRDLPRTSGCTPHDFEIVFDRLQKEYPGRPILHLAYSACTTCSMQSAVIASEERENIHFVDTKQVSAAQGAVVIAVAEYLKANPDATAEQAAAKAEGIAATVRMGFFPGDLDYLRAGGRVSNAAYLGAKLLSLHPLIEILDGKLMSTKKYRGNMAKVVSKLVSEYTENLDAEKPVYLIYGAGLDEKIMRDAEQIVKDKGFAQYSWVQTGCVIAAHSGPGAFGIVGFAK